MRNYKYYVVLKDSMQQTHDSLQNSQLIYKMFIMSAHYLQIIHPPTLVFQKYKHHLRPIVKSWNVVGLHIVVMSSKLSL